MVYEKYFAMKTKNILMLGLILFCAFSFISLLPWFIIFKWSFILYSSDMNGEPEKCYSPNHEYYIKRYQTVAESLLDHELNAEGIAILYDRKGHEIYKGKTPLSQMYGPSWTSFDGGGVSMQGADDWNATLPSIPLKKPGIGEMGCY